MLAVLIMLVMTMLVFIMRCCWDGAGVGAGGGDAGTAELVEVPARGTCFALSAGSGGRPATWGKGTQAFRFRIWKLGLRWRIWLPCTSQTRYDKIDKLLIATLWHSADAN